MFSEPCATFRVTDTFNQWQNAELLAARAAGVSSFSLVGVLIERANPRTMTLAHVSAASSTGRKLGVNYITTVNSSELKLTMLQHSLPRNRGIGLQPLGVY